MKDITIKGREFAIEFEWASQGFRLMAMEWNGSEWETIPNYDGRTLMLGYTHFEALCLLSSDLFDEAVYGEDFATALEIPIEWSEN